MTEGVDTQRQHFPVIPAQAGIQSDRLLAMLDAGVIPAQAGIRSDRLLVMLDAGVIPAQAGIQSITRPEGTPYPAS